MDELKNKTARCYKGIGGEGDMITCTLNKSAGEVNIHPDEIRLSSVDCEKPNDSGYMTCKSKPLNKFRAGQHWNSEFDYCGMLKAGKKAKVTDSLKKLNKLFDSYEDVNYHEESAPLYDAIKLLEKKKATEAEEKIKEFNKLSSQSLKEACE